MYPSLSRRNMRYRGPMESGKMNSYARQTAYSMYQVSTKLEEFQAKLSDLQTGLDDFKANSGSMDLLFETITQTKEAL